MCRAILLCCLSILTCFWSKVPKFVKIELIFKVTLIFFFEGNIALHIGFIFAQEGYIEEWIDRIQKLLSLITRFWIGISHNPSTVFRYPLSTICSSFIAKSFFLFRRTVQLSSVNCSSDIKEELFNYVVMDVVEAWIGSSGDKGIIPSSVGLMVVPLGVMRPGPLTGFIFD